MPVVNKFNLSVIESISKTLGDTNQGFSGREIGDLLKESNIQDPFPSETKWRRLNKALRNS